MTHAAKQASFTDLPARDVAVYYLGAVQQVRNALNGAMRGRVDEDNRGLADHRFLERVEGQLYALAKDDPGKARDLCDRLEALHDDVARYMARRLRYKVDRNRHAQLDRA